MNRHDVAAFGGHDDRDVGQRPLLAFQPDSVLTSADSSADAAPSRVPAISGQVVRAGRPQQPGQPGRITLAQMSSSGPKVRCGGGLARWSPTNKRQPVGPRRRWRASVLPTLAGLPMQPAQHRQPTPNRRLGWLPGLSSANGPADTRSATADRAPGGRPRRGQRPLREPREQCSRPISPIPPPAARPRPRPRAGVDGGPTRPHPKGCKLSARYPGAEGVAGSPSRRQA